jgi:hypothetical protein
VRAFLFGLELEDDDLAVGSTDEEKEKHNTDRLLVRRSISRAYRRVRRTSPGWTDSLSCLAWAALLRFFFLSVFVS